MYKRQGLGGPIILVEEGAELEMQDRGIRSHVQRRFDGRQSAPAVPGGALGCAAQEQCVGMIGCCGERQTRGLERLVSTLLQEQGAYEG